MTIKFKQILLQILSFCIFKGVTFFSVLIFSIYGFSKEYIELEKMIAISNAIVPYALLGVTTAYSHYKIHYTSKNVDDIYIGHYLCILMLFFLSVLLVLFGYLNFEIMLLTLSFVSCRMISQKYKVKNEPGIASFLDAIPYIGILIYFLILVLDLNVSVYFNVIFFAVTCGLFVFLFLMNGVVVIKEIKTHRVRDFYVFSFGAFWISSIISVVMLFPRIYAVQMVGIDAAEQFLLALRYSSVVVLLYQFFSIKFFTKLYSIPTDKLPKFSILVFIVVAFCTSSILCVAFYFGFLSSMQWVFISSILTGFWVISSLLEYYVSKCGAKKMFVYCLLLSMLFSCILFIFKVTNFFIMIFMVVSLSVFSQLVSILYKRHDIA